MPTNCRLQVGEGANDNPPMLMTTGTPASEQRPVTPLYAARLPGCIVGAVSTATKGRVPSFMVLRVSLPVLPAASVCVVVTMTVPSGNAATFTLAAVRVARAVG